MNHAHEHGHHRIEPASDREDASRTSAHRTERSITRRDFLSTVALGFSTMSLLEQGLVRAAVARAQSAGASARLFDIEKVAEGVYAALAKPAALINSNAAIFVNSADVVILDTHSKPSAAAALIAQIRNEVTPKPVRYVVNSHFHWDHMQGNSAYRKSFPDARFIASEATRRLMSLEAAPRLSASLRALPETIEQTRKRLADAKTPEARAFHRKILEEQQAYATEMANFSLELPNVTFGRSLVLHDEAHTLHFAFCGRAHTAGDVVIYCPEKKVVATGDMVHSFFPYMGDCYPREWPATMNVVGEFDFDSIIGGHGPVHRDRVRFHHMRDYISELSDRVAEGKRAGKSLIELQQSIRADSLRSLETDNYANLIREALLRFTPVLGGEISIGDEVRKNIADIFNTLDKT